MIFKFRLNPEPVQSTRFSMAAKRAFTPKKSRNYKASIKEQAVQQMGDRAPFPAKVPLRIRRLEYIFPPLNSFSKKKMQQLKDDKIIYKISAPDLMDNLSKGLFDALEGVVFYDDKYIAECCYIVKKYGIIPGIYLDIDIIEEI